jgi:hypothetical protein
MSKIKKLYIFYSRVYFWYDFCSLCNKENITEFVQRKSKIRTVETKQNL